MVSQEAMEGPTLGMRKKGIKKMEWIDGEEWRNKNNLKTLGTERCENIDTIYILRPLKKDTEVISALLVNYVYEMNLSRKA